MEDTNMKKRGRDYESDSEHDSVEVKRLRDDLLDFLDDSDPVPATQDLDSFMKSFEEEISNSCSTSPRPAPDTAAATVPVVDLTSDSGESNPDLAHLLEASDDELGLPPSGGFSGEEANDRESELVRVSSDSSGIGELWRFDDQGPSYDSFEFNGGAGSHFDDSGYGAFDGLFEHSDVYFESSDYSDFSWRFETLPAEE
ncbi:hypothetical protein RchiOBHm_Chr4g0435381 [Rosa chinensis]|uniref:Uncharacterized protein n=1 Tax=Rosa chinensis TaxID=74649 RepID=A0A2P6R1R9_ROSCH|nr:uncharacterized protein LOC112200390 [Rosa chinensis]PRQ40381.1 hypothetical protein RchiOBHm_Chr4g0435381 [Rosa chinensis]